MPDITGRHGSRRRSINQINMVPFIDVMLVLLIIFMVSAPLITTGLVDLPSVGKSRAKPQGVVEIFVMKTGDELRLKTQNEEPVVVRKAQLVERVKRAQAGNADTPVVISADKAVRYEAVVDVMRRLQEGGVQRVGLAVNQSQ
ncbi:MAG TPA: biopolymer transporter ExbD [Albitalea sp.]